jgi:hypothetical protein
MKKIVTSVALMLAAAISNAQTTATNWTASDCSSVSHTLFTELDAGKVIVFTWVMPCVSCKVGAKAAYDAAQSFATSNPGKVLSYLADDLGDADCATLSTWVTSNSVGSLSNMTIFSNAGNVIKESDFGGTGMPHVVVMAGTDHHIYYNTKGTATYDLPGITAAINTAISALGASDISNANVGLTIVPNPATDVLHVSAAKSISNVTVTTVAGQVVRSEVFAKGKSDVTLSLSGLASGIYVVKVVDADGASAIQKFVKQ